MSENENTIGVTNGDTYIPLFDVDMHYEPHQQMRLRGKRKREITILLAARFNFVSPITLSWLFKIRRYKTLEMLNRLVQQGLLMKAQTIRAIDGVIYTLTYDGAKYATDLMRQEIYYRSSNNTNGLSNVNLNSVVHDCILAYVLMAGIHNRNANGNSAPLWDSFVTEREFRRIYPSSSVKAVDGLVKTTKGEVVAIEVENSTKRKLMYQTSILKFNEAINCDEPLYDKVFLIACSNRVYRDCKRFIEELLKELPHRIDKKTKAPYLSESEANSLKKKIIIRSKFISGINELHYS